MKRKSPATLRTSLRTKSEAKLAEHLNKSSPKRPSIADVRRLVHELEVHQLELEMQNEELATSRARAETLLKQYADLYDFAPLGYFTLAIDGAICRVNLTGARLLGEDRSTLLQRRFGLFVAESARPTLNTFLATVFRNSGKETCEVPLTVPETEPRWIRIEASYSEHSTTPEAFAIVADITARRKIEVALGESEERLDLALRSAAAGTWDWDIGQNRFHWSPQFCQLFGFSSSAAPGIALWRNAIHPEDRTGADSRLQQALEKKTELFNRYRTILPSGEIRWIEEAGKAYYDGRGNPTRVIGICHDITALHFDEETLLRAQKLESIGTLAGGIAHDFNNLLSVVLGQDSLALNKLPPGNPARANIEKSIAATEKAAELTKQLLAYSGKGRFLTEEIDLNRLVTDNIQMLGTFVPKTARIQCELVSPPPHIRGDVSQIQQVIMNLMINAGEAIGQRPGIITVRTGRIELRDDNSPLYREFTNAPLIPGPYAALYVSDTGCGIGKAALDRIFDPFFTTKLTGRGLGLAAVLGIVRGHSGGVRIWSEEGKGTWFEIVLPWVERSVSSPSSDGQRGSVFTGEGKTVLVVDDETAIVELVADILRGAGYSVLSALRPLKGIELYRERQAEIDLVVLDYAMPEMDGLRVFKELKAMNSGVKVLLCSGFAEEEMMPAGERVRPAGFIHKPYTPQKFLERISALMGDTPAG